jgi:uncharacterized protein (DUF2249 family)
MAGNDSILHEYRLRAKGASGSVEGGAFKQGRCYLGAKVHPTVEFNRMRCFDVSSPSMGRLVVDVRAFAPESRRPILFAIVDKLVELNCCEELIIVSDHDPSGLGYQIDLRKETRGIFEFTCDLRSDGAWVAMVERRRR